MHERPASASLQRRAARATGTEAGATQIAAEPYAASAVLEAAMPTQLIVLIVADRFGLDTEFAAFAALVTTVASFVRLWIVHQLLLQ